jgi:hypothetical protein
VGRHPAGLTGSIRRAGPGTPLVPRPGGTLEFGGQRAHGPVRGDAEGSDVGVVVAAE